MTAGTIEIAAVVDPCEGPVMERAARYLATALDAAGRPGTSVRVSSFDSLEAVAREASPHFVVTSLLPELWHHEPVPEVAQRWRTALGAVPQAWSPVLVCTIFRHVDSASSPERREALRERLRGLTLVAIDLSHDLGVNVIDLDRTLSHVGGRALGSDCRLRSDAAIEIAARTVVRSLLALGHDEAIDPEVAARAEAAVGHPWDLQAAAPA